MEIFGFTYGETAKERELRQEVENLRQKLDSAQQQLTAENQLRIEQVCGLQEQITKLEQEKAQVALRLRNYIRTAKRKALRDAAKRRSVS